MSNKQVVLTGKELIRILERFGFIVTGVSGSHHRMKHMDGRRVTVPVHKNDDLPKGLLRKIVKEDLKIDFETLEKMIED